MSWRIIEISSRAKLDFQMNYLVVRGDETRKVHLSEIAMLIIENTRVSLTTALLSELNKQKIKVIFCDEKRNPESELVPYYGAHDESNRIKQQINWNRGTMGAVWTEIVSEKIKNQAALLEKLSKEEYRLLLSYIDEIEFNDASNREGHAAKVYFNALFGKNFTRSADDNINKLLNYGYGILLSCFNRGVVANGYLTQLGIFHDNVYNHFNLSCDLMEPFRPLIDQKVHQLSPSTFSSTEKLEMVNLLNEEVSIDGKYQTINNAIKIYIKSVINALNENDLSLLKFYLR